MSTTTIPPAPTVFISSILPLLLVFISLAAAQSGDQYTGGRQNSNLSGVEHIGHSPNASSNSRGHSAKVARQFLNAHNKVRAAFNLPLLKWDQKLARYARHYGAMRMYDCKMEHSMGEYGENLFWGGQDHWTPAEVVKSWAGEQAFYDMMQNTCQPGEMCGHYTQIIWKNTSKVGCARQKCVNGGLFVICNYDPPGNYVDEHPLGVRPSSYSQDNLSQALQASLNSLV